MSFRPQVPAGEWNAYCWVHSWYRTLRCSTFGVHPTIDAPRTVFILYNLLPLEFLDAMGTIHAPQNTREHEAGVNYYKPTSLWFATQSSMVQRLSMSALFSRDSNLCFLGCASSTARRLALVNLGCLGGRRPIILPKNTSIRHCATTLVFTIMGDSESNCISAEQSLLVYSTISKSHYQTSIVSMVKSDYPSARVATCQWPVARHTWNVLGRRDPVKIKVQSRIFTGNGYSDGSLSTVCAQHESQWNYVCRTRFAFDTRLIDGTTPAISTYAPKTDPASLIR